MTVVSSKDFATNQEMYFNLAINEQVIIRNNNYNFHLICEPIINENVPEQTILKPDDDLRNAVTMDVVKERLNAHITKLFAGK